MMPTRRSRIAVIGTGLACALAALPGSALAGHGTNPLRGAAARQEAGWSLQHNKSGISAFDSDGGSRSGDDDAMDESAQYSLERSLPAASVSSAALIAAERHAASLPAAKGAWHQVTTKPYNANPSNYKDFTWSNIGSGFGIVGGRTTALAADGKYWYAGAADGGVWRSTDGGAKWTPVFDRMPSLSIGSIAINPADHSVWVGTGESNTSQDSYQGTGIYRSANHGKTFTRVGGSTLGSTTVFRVLFDGVGGVYAATDRGLFKSTANGKGSWKLVLAPAGKAGNSPPYYNQVTTVVVEPGTRGQTVLAVVGWRSGGPDNGFYLSTDGGATFNEITPTGDIDATDIGRTTMAYAADGSKLYAIVESPKMLNDGDPSALQGIYASEDGNPTGPWTRIADYTKLENSGSALTAANSPGYEVGVQAWYNQSLIVDPTDPDHVVVGLEEVFETFDGGNTWDTASPYWNYGLACGKSCPRTTHPDQHAAMFAGTNLVIGNDGGVYRRPESDTGYGHWTDLNNTLHTLQYYDARAGRLGGGRLGYWGGLQDNGTSFYATGAKQQAEPAGGDGGTVIVDPKNALHMVGEYTDMAMYATDDGGHTFTGVAPSCYGEEISGYAPRSNCDPNSAFIAPFSADIHNIDHWVTGGQYIWSSTAGWNTRCNPNVCDWKRLYDTGDGHFTTTVTASHNTIYAGWIGGNGEPGPDFSRGIATNVGGTWHELSMTGLPNRYVARVVIDPRNARHVFAVFNGYSRRWIPKGGTGVVFESTDGGNSWRNISGNLPDAPGDALVVHGRTLALATDVGVFETTGRTGHKHRWVRLGSNLPHASVNDLTLAPDGRTLVAASHGRGIWTYRL